MFGRAMADRHGVGIIVSIDYHGASYDIQTPRLLCKHLTAAEVHPVPAGLTLAQAAETLNWRGMADAMATLPRVTSLSPSATLYDWAMDVMSAACDGTAMPERPHGLDAERARAERRSKAIMPTTFAALCERERLAAFADVCRQWRVLGQVVEAPADGRHHRVGQCGADARHASQRSDPVMRLRGRPTRRQSDRTVPVVAFQHRQPRQDRRHGQRGPIRETSSVQHELNGNVERSQTPSCVRSQSTGPASR